MEQGSARLWLATVAAVVLAGVIIPYGVLSGGEAGAGTIVFWVVFGLVVIALVAMGALRWRD